MPSELSVQPVQQRPLEPAVAPGLPEAHTRPVWAMVKAGTPVSSSFTVAAR